MYVDNLEYDSDVTREMTEEELFEYERVVLTVEENKGMKRLRRMIRVIKQSPKLLLMMMKKMMRSFR
jgi:hypothetical protein